MSILESFKVLKGCEIHLKIFAKSIDTDVNTLRSFLSIDTFSNIPLSLDIPETAPPEIPRIILSNANNAKRLVIAKNYIILSTGCDTPPINIKKTIEEFNEDLSKIIKILKKLNLSIENFENKVSIGFGLKEGEKSQIILSQRYLKKSFDHKYFAFGLRGSFIKNINIKKPKSIKKVFVENISVESLKDIKDPAKENTFNFNYVLNSAPIGISQQSYNLQDIEIINQKLFQYLEDATTKF